MLKIIYYSSTNPTEPKIIELNPETSENFECKVGRENSCSMILPSPEVSRSHGAFSLISGRYHFTDLNSKFGTKVNNNPIPQNIPIPISSGDVLQIADFVLELVSINTGEDVTDGGVAPSVIDVTDDSDLTIPAEQDGARPKPSVVTPVIEPVATEVSSPVKQDQSHDILHLGTSENGRWTGGELSVKCVRVINETSDVKTFSFISDPPILFTYKPGQFVTLDLDINGEQVFRSYSISSTPSRPHTLEITVKRVASPEKHLPPGLVSNWLHDNIQVGSQIKLDGAMGRFTCFDNTNQKLLMISAGSGITPMMSMSRWIYDTCANSDVVFLHSACNGQDMIFRQELELMAAKQSNFHLALTLTKPVPGQIWSGLKGRITPQMLQVITPDFSDRIVYVCGPNPFMKHTKAMLKELNFPMENYYEESFGGAKKSKKSSVNSVDNLQAIPVGTTIRSFGISAFLDKLKINDSLAARADIPAASKPVSVAKSPKSCLIFSKTGKEVPCDGEESILEVAEQAGIKMRSGCRAGSCGACKKLKLEGTVKMEGFDPEALNSSDQQAGYILTCISFPIGRVAVDV
jgi:glycine betaine catabolism B